MIKLPSVLNSLALAMLIVVGFATPGWADPVVPCENNTPLQDYINLGSTGCNIGNLLFSNFSYPPGQYLGAEVVPAGNVIVKTHSGPNAGLTFEGEWYSTNVGTLIQLLSYSVAEMSNQPLIDGAALSFDGYAGVAIGAFASVSQTLCLGSVSAPCGASAFLYVSTSTVPYFTSNFLPVAVLGVQNTIFVNGGDGLAEVDEFTNRFSQVPEPGLLLLLGLGASGWMARRRQPRV